MTRLAAFLFAVSFISAQAATPLQQEIEKFDRALFDAFNTCNLPALTAHFSPTLEFYHDNDGLTDSRDRFLADVKKNVCGKFTRVLKPGTLEVWPLGQYGAVYSGTHHFCPVGKTQCVGQGRFLHVLKREGTGWVVTRVVSYDHKALAP